MFLLSFPGLSSKNSGMPSTSLQLLRSKGRMLTSLCCFRDYYDEKNGLSHGSEKRPLSSCIPNWAFMRSCSSDRRKTCAHTKHICDFNISTSCNQVKIENCISETTSAQHKFCNMNTHATWIHTLHKSLINTATWMQMQHKDTRLLPLITRNHNSDECPLSSECALSTMYMCINVCVCFNSLWDCTWNLLWTYWNIAHKDEQLST
jgi:hypothetical protein